MEDEKKDESIDEKEKRTEKKVSSKKSEVEKEDKKREKMVTMRMSEDEYILLKDNADKKGVSVSEYVRKMGSVAIIEEINKNNEPVEKSEDNTDRLVEHIDARIREINQKNTKNILYISASFITGYLIGVASILIVVFGFMKITQ